MYRIIGADGREYGPIPVSVVKKWMAEGRANSQTKVQREGTAEWVTIAEVPELNEPLPGTDMPPSMPPAGAASWAPPLDQDLTSGPAIGLIVTAALGFVAQILGMLSNLFSAGMGMQQAGMNPEMERMAALFGGAVGIALGVLGLITAGLILFGALKMKKRQSYGWAMTASILAIIPCISPCCLVGLPIGIWALVVLSKPEVKAQFH